MGPRVNVEGVVCLCVNGCRLILWWREAPCTIYKEAFWVLSLHHSFVPRPRPAFHCLEYGIAGEPGNEANSVINGQVRTWHPNVVSHMISLY